MGKRKKKSSPTKKSTKNDPQSSSVVQSPKEQAPKRPPKRSGLELDETNLRRSMRTLRIPPEDFPYTSAANAGPAKYIKLEPASPPRLLKTIKPEPVEVPEYRDSDTEDMMAHTRQEPEIIDISENGNDYGDEEATQRLDSQSGAMVQLNMTPVPDEGIYGTQIMLASSDHNLPVMSCSLEELFLGRYSFPDIFPQLEVPLNTMKVYVGLTSEDLTESLRSQEQSTIWRSFVTQNILLDEKEQMFETEIHYQERIISLTECVGKTVNIRSNVESELSVVQQKLSPLEIENKRLNAQVTELIAERDKSATHHKAEMKANEQRSFHEKKYTEAVETFKTQREKKVKELEIALKATKKELDAVVKTHKKKINGLKNKTLKIVKHDIGEIDQKLKLHRREFALLKCFVMYSNEFLYKKDPHHHGFFKFLCSKLDEEMSDKTTEQNELWEQIQDSFVSGKFSDEILELLYKAAEKERRENDMNFKKDILKKIKDLYGEGENEGSDAEVNLSEDESRQQLPTAKRLMLFDSKFDKFKSPLMPMYTPDSSNVGVSKNVLSMPQLASPNDQTLKTPKRPGPAVSVSKSKTKAKSKSRGPRGTRGRPKKPKGNGSEDEDDSILEVSFGQDENSAELGLSDSEEEVVKKKIETPAVKRTKSRFKRKRNQDSSSSEPTDSESEVELDNKKRRISVRFDTSQRTENNHEDSALEPEIPSTGLNKSSALSDSEEESEGEVNVKKAKVTLQVAPTRTENVEGIQDLRNDLELSDESEGENEKSKLEEKQPPVETKSPSKSKKSKSGSRKKNNKKSKKATPSKEASKEKKFPKKRSSNAGNDEKATSRKSFNYSINTSTRTLRARPSTSATPVKKEVQKSNIIPGFGMSQKELVKVAKVMVMEAEDTRKRKSESAAASKNVNEVQDNPEKNKKLEKDVPHTDVSKEETQVSTEENLPTPASVPKSPSKKKTIVTLRLKSPAATKSRAKPKPVLAQPASAPTPIRSVRERIGDTTIPIPITGKHKSCQKSILNEQIENAVKARKVKTATQKKSGSSAKPKPQSAIPSSNKSTLPNSPDVGFRPPQLMSPQTNPYQNMNMMGYPPMGNQFGFPGMYNPYTNQMNPGFPGFGVNNYQTPENSGEAESQSKSPKKKNRKQELPSTLSPTGQLQEQTANSFMGNSMFPGMMNPMMNMNPMFNPGMFMNPMFGNSVMPSQYMMNCMNPMMNTETQNPMTPLTDHTNDSSSLRASKRTKRDEKNSSSNTPSQMFNPDLQNAQIQDNNWTLPGFGFGLPGFNPNFFNQAVPPQPDIPNDGNAKTPKPSQELRDSSDSTETDSDSSTSRLVVDEPRGGQGNDLSTGSDVVPETSRQSAVYHVEVTGNINTHGVQKYLAQKELDALKKNSMKLINPEKDDDERIDMLESPMSPCPSPSSISDSMAEKEKEDVPLTPKWKTSIQRVLHTHLKSKTYEAMKQDVGLAGTISKLKQDDILPPAVAFARALYERIHDRTTEPDLPPSETYVPLKICQHKVLLFIERLVAIDKAVFGDLGYEVWKYYVNEVLPREHILQKYSTVGYERLVSIGRFFGALCRQFLTPQHSKDFIYAVLIYRPKDAANIVFNCLCSSMDFFSMLPEPFDYEKVTPCEKLILFALRNPIKYKHLGAHAKIKSLLEQGLKHPPFDCTWDLMLLNTLTSMCIVESDEQLLSAAKGLSMLMVQGGWKWISAFFRSHFDDLVKKWIDSKLPSVVLAGFLKAVGFGAEKSEDNWDINYLEKELTKLMNNGKGRVDAIMEEAISICRGNFDKAKLKIIRNKNKNHTPPDRRGQGKSFAPNKKKKSLNRAQRNEQAKHLAKNAGPKGAPPFNKGSK